jgi:hypothetical protein
MTPHRIHAPALAIMIFSSGWIALGGADMAMASQPGPVMPSTTMSYQKAEAADDADQGLTPTAPPMSTGSSKPAWAEPFSFEIAYYLYSDYIFRGINFSDYETEGVEDLNHQMTTSLGVDVALLFGGEAGSLGTFNFDTFFEWYAGQEQLDPEKGGQSLQEVDYVLGWSYDIEPIATTIGTGFVFYVFPSDTALNTEEIYLSFEHNDAWMWKWLFPDNEDGVLNPSLFLVHDVGQAAGAGWYEFGISHGFALPAHVTVTPSFTMAFDRSYIGRTLDIPEVEQVGLAYLQYGLDVSYDLSAALEIPEEYGALTLSGFLYYNDARDRYNKEGSGVENVLFGGFSLAWGF